MAKNKTNETNASVNGFIDKIENEAKRDDAYQLMEIFQRQTRLEPKMWGPSIIGFGSYHYKYESGHEGDSPMIAFSPRSTALVLYLDADFPERKQLLEKLGKHKESKACIYIKKLSDVDSKVLNKMISSSFAFTKKKI